MGDDELLRQMGERMSARRRQMHITQEELADRMDVSPQMISYAEQGRKAIRPENLVKLCAALGVSADYILTGRSDGPGADSLARKLSRLSAEELALVETVLDCCLALARKG